MSSPLRILPLLLAFAACGGRSAAAEPPAPAPAGDLAHAYLYQVAPERVEQGPPTIEVSGSASVHVSPDVARVSVAVETHDKQAAVASAGNAEAMGRVMAALRAASLPGLRVETFGYTLNPEYSAPSPRDDAPRAVVGYTALNNVRITVTDVQAAGKVLDTAIKAGANRVTSLSFEASETADARRRALSMAVAEARAQAEAIADALGRSLGDPIEIHGGAQAPQPRPQAMGLAMMRAEGATPVEAADQTVVASVSIRFALGPEKGSR
jgi:uncharacterized protein